MGENKPKVIVIPAAPKNTGPAEQRQLRVAAYCRVSTKEEDQLNSYEAQKAYYTRKIMENKEWTMAGIFADEGVTGTSTKKREDFMRMMKWCKQGKIDLILTKSVSRFARNTVDGIRREVHRHTVEERPLPVTNPEGVNRNHKGSG